MENRVLQHHGIKGMKWGVRRYQNKDGTLTNAGKKRYDHEMAKLKEEQKVLKNQQRTKAKIDKLESLRKEIDDQKNEQKNEPKKRVRDLSDAELKARIDRLQLEKNYKDLLNETRNSTISKGSKFVESVLTKSGENLVTQVVNHYGAKGLNKLIGETREVVNETTGEIRQVLQEVIYANNKRK